MADTADGAILSKEVTSFLFFFLASLQFFGENGSYHGYCGYVSEISQKVHTDHASMTVAIVSA